MSLVLMLVIIAIIAVIVWFLTTQLNMSLWFKKIIYFVAILFVAIFILQALGLMKAVTEIKVHPITMNQL